MANSVLVLPVAAPFRLDFTAWALRRRQTNVVDRWARGYYTRVLVGDAGAFTVTIAQPPSVGEPTLIVTVESDQEVDGQLLVEVRLLIEKMFGLTVDLQAFYAMSERNPVLASLVKRFAGVRPPRFPTIFEALVNSIACQQVSLDSGIAALNRLSERFGRNLVHADTRLCAFPRPVDLAEAAEDTIRELGFSRQKSRAIKEMAVNVASEQVDLISLEEMTNEDVVERLSQLRGIGRWSSEYVLLRGLGRLETFPADDVGAQNNLQRLFDLDRRPGYDEIKALVAQWNPYQGLVYFHLLLEKLRLKGFV